MFEKPVFLSTPKVVFGENKTKNEDVLAKVRDNYKGDETELKRILQGINMVFRYCNTNTRYLGTADGKKPIDYAVQASQEALTHQGLSADDVDLVIYAGIYREYFEPAVAMEVAGKLGIKNVQAFDITSACAGMLQAVSSAVAHMQSDSSINVALITALDFPDICIDYDIQSFEDLGTKAAGLTLGSGAASWILTRKPLANGGVRIVATKNVSMPESYDICRTPVFGKFTSNNTELFDLGRKNVPEIIRQIVTEAGWNMKDINHFISHQAGKKIIKEIYDELQVDIDKVPVTHHLYGNTVNITLPMTFDFLLNHKPVHQGDKFVFTTVAAGFTMVSLAGIWETQ